MKHYKYLSMLVFVLVAVLFPTSPALAGAQRTTFTGTSSFGESINPGEWTYLPGGNIQARGIVELYHDVNTDPRVTGEETTNYNDDFKPAPLPRSAWRVEFGAPSMSRMRAGAGMAGGPPRS